MKYKELEDDLLIELLFTEEDRLPREAVDEFVSRGERMVDKLAELIADSYCWNDSTDEWWMAIHTTFILGAIGTSSTILPLLKALRYASAYDCDWVTNALPSIFRNVGAKALEGLKTIALDRTSDWYLRTVASESLAAISLSHTEKEREIFDCIGSLLTDEDEEWDVRRTAAYVLLDFRRNEFLEPLLKFGKEERKRKADDLHYMAGFYEEDVNNSLGKKEPNLIMYTQDWLSFYDEDQIERRQKRWKKEEEEAMLMEEDEEIMKNAHEKVISSGIRPYIRDDAKVGRNEPCPCGSGKKYKKCCGIVH